MALSEAHPIACRRDLTATAKLAYLLMENGARWGSLQEMAAACGCSNSTAAKASQQLRAEGLCSGLGGALSPEIGDRKSVTENQSDSPISGQSHRNPVTENRSPSPESGQIHRKSVSEPAAPPAAADPAPLSELKTPPKGGSKSPTPPNRGLDEFGILISDEPIAKTRRALRLAWSEGWRAKTGETAPRTQLNAAANCAEDILSEAVRRRADPEALARSCVAGFFAAKARSRRPKADWLAEDPLGYAAASHGTGGDMRGGEAARSLREKFRRQAS